MAEKHTEEFSEMSGLKVGVIIVVSFLVAATAWAGIKKAVPALA